MKRVDFVQLVVIIVGLASCLLLLEKVPQFLTMLIGFLKSSANYPADILLMLILMIGTYLLFIIYSLKNSKQLAEFICAKASFEAKVDFHINKAELLYAVIIGMGLYGIMKELPALLINSYEYITTSNKGMLGINFSPISDKKLWIDTIQLLLYFLLIYYAKTFADFFSAKISNTEPEDEITGKEIAEKIE